MSAEKFINDNLEKYFKLFENPKKEISEKDIFNAKEGIETFIELISPQAAPFLEIMAQKAQQITWERFGRVIRLYAPIYISNECTNSCAYCGFSFKHKFERKTLTNTEIAEEMQILKSKGVRHVLIVGGESPKSISAESLVELTKNYHADFPSLSVEVAPMSEEDYQLLTSNGIEGLAIYQETYDAKRYAEVHPAGKKRDYSWRLATAERGAKAGMRHISLGVLLGLSDSWEKDSIAIALHTIYLMKNFWKAKYAVSLPRLCECEGGFPLSSLISDRQLAQLIFAYRIAFPDLAINLSTRESAQFRDNLAGVGVTHMSSESTTEPGGYAKAEKQIKMEGKQFLPHDTRKTHEFCAALLQKGLEPVWKDWDSAIQ